MVGLAQRVVVAHAWFPGVHLGFRYPNLELEWSALSVAQFKGVTLEVALGDEYTPVDLGGQVDVVVDVPLPR